MTEWMNIRSEVVDKYVTYNECETSLDDNPVDGPDVSTEFNNRTLADESTRWRSMQRRVLQGSRPYRFFFGLCSSNFDWPSSCYHWHRDYGINRGAWSAQ